MGIFSKLWDKVTGTEKVKVRARNKKGHYVADDKSTPDVKGAADSKKTTHVAAIATGKKYITDNS